MHSCKQKKYVILTKHLSKDHRKHGVIDQAKYRKRASKRKQIDREYHIQGNYGVAHKDVKMYCDENQFPALKFCAKYIKPHGARGLSKHYHLCFDQKIGHGICAILWISCACVACKKIIDQSCIYGIPLKKAR